MLSSSFKRLASLLSTLAVITSVAAVPFEAPVETRDLTRRLVTGAPRFVVYQSVVPSCLNFEAAVPNPYALFLNIGMHGSRAKLALPPRRKSRVTMSCRWYCATVLLHGI